MRARRGNPWPGIADLFAGLMVAALAAFVVSNGIRVQDEEVLVRTLDIQKKLRDALNIDQADPDLENCNFDTCIPISINFKLNDDALLPDGVGKIQELCQRYIDVIDHLGARNQVVLVIEGHTDPREPSGPDEEANARYNWELSARRATSVLRAFNHCGVSHEEGFEIAAAGYADSRPIQRAPGLDEAQWFDARRRITLRARVNQDAVRRTLESP